MAPVEPRRKRAPEVVVFSEPKAAQAKGGSDKFAYKAFMSSRITKINAARPKEKTVEERKEEAEDRRHDRELKELLEGKVMIEKLHESQLDGRERHKHNAAKLAALGMKVKTKLKMPANMYYASQRNRAEKAKKEIQDAKDRGVLNAAMKRDIEAAHMGKPAPARHRHKRGDGGPNAGPGRFKDGVLHVSKSHINRVAAQARQPARIGKQGKKGKSRR
ncbi:hypothetical protein IWQ57_000460 [Coemansia nantahalensis]|uniref:Uncharacterized protein n=2 Tax=Coemansia TaxID=4863 RepID=A0ACC1L8Z8_9FUNG|nr:hypothetical protein IWQ57_000460 [Coemansia nantahalensis]KAJ2803599.1 hypothetical protein H4R21_001975 [Coemansia helicoidea]